MQQQTHTAIIALGSNSGQEENIGKAMESLQGLLTDVRHSRMLWTEPIGLRCDRFLNVMMAGRTRLSLEELTASAKRIERDMGRNGDDSRRGRVCIDIDIMLYDGQRLHADDWQRDYIRTQYKDISD